MKHYNSIVYFVWSTLSLVGVIMEVVTPGEGLIVTSLAMIWHTIKEKN